MNDNQSSPGQVRRVVGCEFEVETLMQGALLLEQAGRRDEADRLRLLAIELGPNPIAKRVNGSVPADAAQDAA